MTATAPLSIVGARLPDGRTTTIRIVDGLVSSLDDVPRTGDTVLDAAGRLVLPAFAEAHAHLDKAFLAETVPNPTGDLIGACVAMDEHRDRLTLADTEARAERAARLILANGATAIRTHADVALDDDLRSVRALVAVRERLRDLVDIEIVALCGWPSVGAAGAELRARMRDAIAMGCDLVGGCPHLEDDPIAANASFLEIADDLGVGLDLHTDETTDPTRFSLEDLADRVLASGFLHGVTASHAVSLGAQGEPTQRRTAEKLAAAGIGVVALPSTNLFLQGRDQQSGMPRGLTALRALGDAGVTVAAGADNLQDPFNPVGRGDCLETASLMVTAGHLLPEAALASVSTAARRLMRRPSADLRPGSIGDLVLVPASTVREAIAFGPAGRTVVRAGRIVADAAAHTRT